MKKFIKGIWEHLKTKKKYNTLNIKYEASKQDRRDAETRYEIKKRIWEIKEREYESALKEQEDQIIELKKKLNKKSKKVEK